ncbi:hypothetical protein A2154_04550 [Candidatus Gottesmanbacteria bacterium RBG_16_43_7]|uniref:DNA topoisomerase type IA zn finger domain-containing protein n=1 Tax=Candidatus Gottesmanbacteria bacterium RBG_16_43_7 TaxID=1798373 RepID=A0A1F5ZBI7_9BACT|nr:MAG: hypothetical protein A2154_04550 [Candidatus Gottesmanbacteria bacterium RBG_16_43_7]
MAKTVASEVCPKCGSPLGEVTTTPSGRKLQRCSAGSWNQETRKTEGCEYVKWLPFEPQSLDESCPKCGSPLILTMTRFGKKLKKCSTSGWDKQTRTATGCDYVEWIGPTNEPLDEDCPQCGEKLMLVTTARGKRLKKCSTSGWDRENRVATGCTYVQWL